jgi:phospholipid/cholesterol/gamma-HCH transport system ATP-binding protein
MKEESSHLLMEVKGIRKRFGDHSVLSGVDLDVPKGKLVTVLGRSGAGKSVFLKCLADVLPADEGEIFFEHRLLSRTDPSVRADFRKRCSFLFQSNALFDSLTALENVALPLEQTTRLSDEEIRERCLDALGKLELSAHQNSYPAQLSGGMQKRLALARAIVTRPDLVLFDEPTAGLDPLRRNAVFLMIAKYQRQFGFTAVVVTHDVTEALVASDRVALLDQGRMYFQGSPAEFTASADPVVKSFRESADQLASALASIRDGVDIHPED